MVVISRAERGLPFLPRAPSSAQSSPADPSMPWARSGSQALTPGPLSQLVQGQPFSPTQAGAGLAASRAKEPCFTRACVSLKSCRLTDHPRILRAALHLDLPQLHYLLQVSPGFPSPKPAPGGWQTWLNSSITRRYQITQQRRPALPTAPQPATSSRTGDFYNHALFADEGTEAQRVKITGTESHS